MIDSFSGSVKAVASSKIITGLSFNMALAMAMRCFSPPERLLPLIGMVVYRLLAYASKEDTSWARHRVSATVSASMSASDTGKEIQSRLYGKGKSESLYSVSDTVEIYYNPEAPAQITDASSHAQLIKGVAAIVFGLFIFIVIAI